MHKKDRLEAEQKNESMLQAREFGDKSKYL
jgi:hypothetical protein